MLKMNKFMAPPWLKYPHIPCGSIGWRMGYGECYMEEFYKWYDSLDESVKGEYDEKFPKPLSWALLCERLGDFSQLKWRTDGNQKYSASDIGKKDSFVYFWLHKSSEGKCGEECFSQWYESFFCVGHREYWCAEQYMMSEKARLFGDKDSFDMIMSSRDQTQIKALGRNVKGFDEEIWNRFKYLIVLNGNYYKFSSDEKLRKILLNTGSAVLAEASPYDRVWGIGIDEEKAKKCGCSRWRGENLLGFALMEVRDELARIWKYENELDFNMINGA